MCCFIQCPSRPQCSESKFWFIAGSDIKGVSDPKLIISPPLTLKSLFINSNTLNGWTSNKTLFAIIEVDTKYLLKMESYSKLRELKPVEDCATNGTASIKL